MRIIKRHHFFLTLFYCVLFAWLIGLYQASPAFQEDLNLAVVNAQNQLNRLMGRKVVPVNQATSQKTSDSAVTNARWTQPSATVYVDLNNPTLRSATEEAINRWNQTGAFAFHTTQNKSAADIIVTAIDEPKNGAAGLTNTAEHELGHAIGLQHSSAVSVMQPTGSYYSIQPQDVENVKKLYAKHPATDHQNGPAGTTQNYQ